MKNSNCYTVILAGGKGERLWPLSRQSNPKQFLTLDNKQSLLDLTYNRMKAALPDNSIFFIITDELREHLVAHNTYISEQIFSEPHARNTGPAILLSCLEISSRAPEALCIFVPADHYITRDDQCTQALLKAVEYSTTHDVITLLGIKPTYPATGYGYIEYIPTPTVCPVATFHEKPSIDRAHQYYQAKNVLWNTGIFCGKSSVFIEEYKRLAPDLYQHVLNYFSSKNPTVYQTVDAVSIDYAIMEKSNKLYVVPCEFEWSDVGNLATFITLQNSASTQQLAIDSKNNLVMVKNSLTVLVGVDDLCIVQTDDVLLVCKRDTVEKVKNVVHELKKNKLEQYL